MEIAIAAVLIAGVLALLAMALSAPGGSCADCGAPVAADETLCDECDDARQY